VIIPLSAAQPQATGAAPATPPGPGTSGSAASQLDQDTFLKLMVAQLRNQDPMNPTDSSQFLAQTAQFTSLEKLGQVADQSAQALAAQMAFGASGMVGKTITYTDADGAEATGAVASVRFGPSGPLLDVDGAEVALDKVVALTA
jgi:flagellar basal-body rod modification protein FlgD